MLKAAESWLGYSEPPLLWATTTQKSKIKWGEKMAWDPPLQHPLSWVRSSSLFLSCSRAAVAQLIEVRSNLFYRLGGGQGCPEIMLFSLHLRQRGQVVRTAGNLRWLQGVRGFLWEMLVAFCWPSTRRKVLLKC